MATTDKTPRLALTPRGMKFARLVAGGMSQADSYKEAYNKPHLLPQDAAHRGHFVAKQPGVKAHIQWLQRASNAVTLLTVNDRLYLLAESIQAPAISASERSARARCVEVYTKLAGGAVPDRLEITGKDGEPIAVAADVTVTNIPIRKRLAALREARRQRDADV